MSNTGCEWLDQGFILEVRKVTVMLLQYIVRVCHLYIRDFFQVDHTLFHQTVDTVYTTC
uniref:Uncharacterized protein n=1 Tax=Sciurus vulgaris TaxID=55149 RepID=A0A8D2DPY1_SCIVU